MNEQGPPEVDKTALETLRQKIRDNPARMFPLEDEPNLSRLAPEMGFQIERRNTFSRKHGLQTQLSLFFEEGGIA